MGLISIITIFMICIVVHEFGHFIVAKLLGREVVEFSVGMGPLLLQKEVKGTLVSLRLLPIGGYCNISENEGKDTVKDLCIDLAGVFMNFLLSVLCVVLCSMVYPENGEKTYMVVESGIENISVGDYIIKEDSDAPQLEDGTYKISFIHKGDRKIQSFEKKEDMMNIKVANLHQTLTYRSIGAIVIKMPQLMLGAVKGIGESFNIEKRKNKETEGATVIALLKDPDSLVEDVKVYPFFLKYLRALFLISCSLAVFNLIPIPCLDGGRVLLVLLNIITFNKISKKFQAYVIATTYVILLGSMLIMSILDLIYA